MSQGMGAGRPRKHPRDPAVGQLAIDAEWQDIADEKSEAIIQKQKYVDYSMTALVDKADDGNNRFAAIILAIQEISQDANLEDVQSLYDCFHKYLEFCYEHNVNITNSSAYMACGISKQTVSAWSLGMYRAAHDPEYKKFAQYVQQMCGINREQMMVDGKLNPIVAIWHQKNYDGFTDRPPELTAPEDETEDPTVSEIAQKYANIGDD